MKTFSVLIIVVATFIYITVVNMCIAEKPLKGDIKISTKLYNDFLCRVNMNCRRLSVVSQDCNRDGVTDCDDYAMLHFNLKEDCRSSLDGTNFGRRYSTCRPTSKLPGSHYLFNFIFLYHLTILLKEIANTTTKVASSIMKVDISCVWIRCS